MPHGPKKITFLAGSPTAYSLSWEEDALISTLCPRVQRYLDGTSEEQNESQTTTSFSFPAWRLVTFKTEPRHISSVPAPKPSSPIHDASAVDEDRSDFIEHSFAVMQNLQSSQIQPQDEGNGVDTTGLTSFATADTFSTTTSSFAISDDSTLLPTPVPVVRPLSFSGPISDLHRIPSASHLQRLHPQTVTVNLVVGVISLSPPRTVSLRRQPGMEMEIVEVVVGDETRAGFEVSFWLTPLSTTQGKTFRQGEGSGGGNSSSSNGVSRTELQSLRSGDVVLLTNVALSVYRNRVYGQSLNRRATRNRTTATVVRGATGWMAAPTSEALAVKCGKVREWADQFVGRGGKRVGYVRDGQQQGSKRRRTREGGEEEEILPPDTQ